jgi:hypothetical protein
VSERVCVWEREEREVCVCVCVNGAYVGLRMSGGGWSS